MSRPFKFSSIRWILSKIIFMDTSIVIFTMSWELFDEVSEGEFENMPSFWSWYVFGCWLVRSEDWILVRPDLRSMKSLGVENTYTALYLYRSLHDDETGTPRNIDGTWWQARSETQWTIRFVTWTTIRKYDYNSEARFVCTALSILRLYIATVVDALVRSATLADPPAVGPARGGADNYR